MEAITKQLRLFVSCTLLACLILAIGTRGIARAQTWESPMGAATLGGGALLAGACTSGTASVTGAQTGMLVVVNPASDPLPALTTGVAIHAWVSSTGTVTVRVCAIIAVTPNSVAYNVRVIQ